LTWCTHQANTTEVPFSLLQKRLLFLFFAIGHGVSLSQSIDFGLLETLSIIYELIQKFETGILSLQDIDSAEHAFAGLDLMLAVGDIASDPTINKHIKEISTRSDKFASDNMHVSGDYSYRELIDYLQAAAFFIKCLDNSKVGDRHVFEDKLFFPSVDGDKSN
jgi:hypothetical protein